MKRVKQVHVTGCGIACVAMIRGCSYKKALTYFSNYVQERLFELKGTSIYDLQYALRQYAKIQLKIKPFTGEFPKKDAIFVVDKGRVREDGSVRRGWHWVVWDSKRRLLLDPSPRWEHRYVRGMMIAAQTGDVKLNSYYEIDYIPQE